MITFEKKIKNKCKLCNPCKPFLHYNLILKDIYFFSRFTIGLHSLHSFSFFCNHCQIAFAQNSNNVIRFTYYILECKPIKNKISICYSRGLHGLQGLHVFLTLPFPVFKIINQ
jgi:hypothetical protein